MKTFQQLQEEIHLTEASSKGVVFMFGRFNPPTLGHEKMVKRAVQVAKRAGIREVRLYPSFTQDSKKNPLPHREKVKWLSKFFKGVKVINSTDARTPFAAARQISDQGFKRVIMIAGGDRIKEFQSQISKYIKHPDPDKSFEFDEFQVVSAGERDPDADDASGMSASKMRAFAAAGDFDNFSKGLPSRAKESDASSLYDAIRRGMNLKESMSAEENEVAFIEQLRCLKSPDIAEEGKCYSVVWADGRGIVAYRNRIDAVRFIESGDRDVVSVDYQDIMRESGRSLMVRNKFVPDRSSIDEEWPKELDEAMGSIKGWFDTKRNKLVEILAGDKYHDWAPINSPARFGLKPADIAPFVADMEKGRDEIFALQDFMLDRGWAKILQFKSSDRITWNIAAIKLSQVHKAALGMQKHFRTTATSLFIDSTSLPSRGASLYDNQIIDFLKRGKIIQRTEIGSTMARFR